MLLLLLALVSWSSAMADDMNFDGHAKYYITCDYQDGYVCLGSEHGVSYPVYYETYADGLTEDAYWTISQKAGLGYLIRNANTGQYLGWSDNYADCRYMDVYDEVTELCYWDFLSQDDGSCVIQSLFADTYFFNLRTGTKQVGTYSGSSSFSSNGKFRFNLVESGDDDGDDDHDGDIFWEAPIKTTTIQDGEFAKGTVWYRLSIRGGKQLFTDGIDIRCLYGYKDYAPEFFWCFEKTKQNLYRVYNYATGPQQPMNAYSSGNGVPLLMSGEENTYFEITENSWGFNLKIPYEESYCNDFADAGYLKLWASAQGAWDSGSRIEIEEIGDVNFIPIEDITLSSTELTMNEADVVVLGYGYTPVDATLNGLWWDSSNPAVVKVEDNGTLIARGLGEATITLTSIYDPSVYATCTVHVVPYKDPNQSEVLAHSDAYVYLRSADGSLTAIPDDYMESRSLIGNRFTAYLVNGERYEQSGVTSMVEDMPYALPTFTSYKFNNKYNHQVFTDVIAETPGAEKITMKVGGIGKRLTASFQVESDDVRVWVGDELQESKLSRLRFDHPITYTIGYDNWKELQIHEFEDGREETKLMPYGHHTTVTVDWLTDHPTTEYGVPVINIVTETGDVIYSKYDYVGATIEIDGAGIFPDMTKTDLQIRGRGNSSWGGWGSKNPYRLKFPSKVKPFGLPKSKSWVLLANKQDGSMTTNALGHKIAYLMGSAGACDIIPVELYINGQYQGSYNFTEKVGFSNSSIDLEDDTYAAMIELDTYSDEGKTSFYSNAYGMASKVHDPDVEEYDYAGLLDVDGVIADFDLFTEKVAAGDGSYVNYVDVDNLVSFLATCDLMCQRELMHPKSVFLYSENVTDAPNADGVDETPWVFGPLWDCDWAFGYEQAGNYYQVNETDDYFEKLLGSGSPRNFWNALRYGSEEVDKAYYRRWVDFMEHGGIDELLEYCDDYYRFASRSLEHDNEKEVGWSSWYDYADVTYNSKVWLKTRSQYIYQMLNLTHQPEEEVIEELLIADGSQISAKEDKAFDITYTRNFKNTNWQPLYVPFSMRYSDWADLGIEVARINGFYEYDDDENGTIDRSALEVLKVKSGKLIPNHPYLVRATSVGEHTIHVGETTLCAAKSNSIDCSTVETRYTFKGTYNAIKRDELNAQNAYIMSSGILRQSASDLNPMRWYMTREGRDGQLLPILSEIKVFVAGEEDPDAIDMVRNENRDSQDTYNLLGQKVSGNTRGIVIRNGRKIVK